MWTQSRTPPPGVVLALLDLPCQDLQDEVCIGGVRGGVHGLITIVTAEIVQIQQRFQAGAVPADQAHPGPGPNDAPVLLFRLFQEPGRFPCGGGAFKRCVGIPRLLGPTGDHRHGGVGRLHPGPGPGRRPELAPGQGQNYPRQSQQQCAEGRLHRPPGQLVHGIHKSISFRVMYRKPILVYHT